MKVHETQLKQDFVFAITLAAVR